MIMSNPKTNLRQYTYEGYEAELEVSARQFLENIDKENFYPVVGNEISGDGEIEPLHYYHYFSPEEVDYIQRRAVELARETGLESSTFREVVEDTVQLRDLGGRDARFDELLFDLDPFEFCTVDIIDIDFEHPIHLYDMSVRVYDEEKDSMDDPVHFPVHLSDDEFVFLLVKTLHGRTAGKFTFNKLLDINPSLAQKINEQALDSYCRELVRPIQLANPFLIQMNSIVEAADAINAQKTK